MEVITVGVANHAAVVTLCLTGDVQVRAPGDYTGGSALPRQTRKASKAVERAVQLRTSLIVQHRDAAKPPEFEHDSALAATQQELQEIAKAGLQDVWVDMHCLVVVDNWMDQVHATRQLTKLAAGAYPKFLGASDHKALQVDFEPPAFDNEGLQSRFYYSEEILRDQVATEDLEQGLRKIESTGAVVGRCIVLYQVGSHRIQEGLHTQEKIDRTHVAEVAAGFNKGRGPPGNLCLSLFTRVGGPAFPNDVLLIGRGV